jgi:hypothetical protein
MTVCEAAGFGGNPLVESSGVELAFGAFLIGWLSGVPDQQRDCWLTCKLRDGARSRASTKDTSAGKPRDGTNGPVLMVVAIRK